MKSPKKLTKNPNSREVVVGIFGASGMKPSVGWDAWLPVDVDVEKSLSVMEAAVEDDMACCKSRNDLGDYYVRHFRQSVQGVGYI